MPYDYEKPFDSYGFGYKQEPQPLKRELFDVLSKALTDKSTPGKYDILEGIDVQVLMEKQLPRTNVADLGQLKQMHTALTGQLQNAGGGRENIERALKMLEVRILVLDPTATPDQARQTIAKGIEEVRNNATSAMPDYWNGRVVELYEPLQNKFPREYGRLNEAVQQEKGIAKKVQDLKRDLAIF